MADEYDITRAYVSFPPDGYDRGVYIDERGACGDAGYGGIGSAAGPSRFGSGALPFRRPSFACGPAPEPRRDAFRGAPAQFYAASAPLSRRREIDAADWDERPPHYAPDTPNADAHLFVDPRARGPPVFFGGAEALRDGFGKNGGAAPSLFEVVLFVCLVALVVIEAARLQVALAALGRRGDLGAAPVLATV